jgi:hypothetical protein
VSGDFINTSLLLIGSLIVVLITIKIIAIAKNYKRQEGLEETTMFEISKESNKESYEEVEALAEVPMELPWKVKSLDGFEIKEYESSKQVPLNRNLKDNINNLVKLTPSAIDIVETDKKVIIKFSKDILDKVKSGELTLMKTKGKANEFRPIVVDSKHKIRGHGSIELKNKKK